MKLWLKNNLSKSEECVDTEPLACTDLICYDSFEYFWKFKRHFLKSLGYCFQVIFGTGPVQHEERLKLAFLRSVTSPLE